MIIEFDRSLDHVLVHEGGFSNAAALAKPSSLPR